jgi:hypothetical protein
MLKRVTICLAGLAVVAGVMFSTAAPALADPTYHGKYCTGVLNSQLTRGFQYCISVMQGPGGDVWARTEVWDYNGLNDPYYLDGGANLDSKITANSTVCNGRYPGCSGNGDVEEQVIHSLPSTYANAIQINTDHYANGEHLCLNRGHALMHFKLYQGDPLDPSGAYTSAPDWWNSYPDCTGY